MAPPSPLSVDEARRAVLAAAAPLPAATAPLDGDLLGRLLARDAVAAEPVPAADNSAMDGFALRSQDVRRAGPEAPVALSLRGESRAGAPARVPVGPGEAVAISTGALIPAGADAVVRVEDTQAREDSVEVAAAVRAGENVRRAGDDIRPGQTVVRAGMAIGPAELGVLASLGLPEVACAPRPRVRVLVTGDELLAPGEAMRAGAVRDTNSLTVPALVRMAGGQPVGVERVGDDAPATREAVARALDADVTIVCGGVSVGVHDHVRPALAAAGAQERFWGLALRPGHPTWFGVRGETLVFGLPGNPVSAMVVFVLLARPALLALQGAAALPDPADAVLQAPYEKRAGRTHAVRVRLRMGGGGWEAAPLPAQGSHVLTSLMGADALALLPADAERLEAGTRVPVEMLPGARCGG